MLKKLVRTLQTHFPFLLELKFDLQRRVRAMLRKPFEPDFAVLEQIQFSADEVFVDVGANRGQSIDAMALFCPDRLVHAFEPNGILFSRLQARYGSDAPLQLINSGLSDAAGTFNLFIPVYNGWEFDGLASFDRASAESWLNPDTLMFFDKARMKIEEISCQVTQLDDYRLHAGFIKIDVQGLEDKVILGGIQTIARCRPVLLIETESASDALEATLPERYLPCAWRDRQLFVGTRGSLNTLYFPEERLTVFKGVKTYLS
jgi:FkbM family methyltransferase